MDESIISIGDLLAVLARKGKQIICYGIVLALLFGGLKGVLIWKNMNDEEYVDFDRAAYEQEMLSLEQTLERVNRNISYQEDYIANSMWMQINPYDKYTTEIYLMISGIDESDINMTFGDTTTPRDYLLSRITTQYSIFWSAEDLPKSIGLSKYEHVQDKYLRELVSVAFLDEGVIRITAIGNSEMEARELANAAADLLTSKSEMVKQNSFNHNISVFNTIEQNQIDTGMLETQYNNYVQLDTYNARIIETEKAMVELEEPDSVPVAIIKMILIGGILGGILACAWYLGKAFMMGSIQSSAHLERSLSMPFCGTMVKQKGLFPWLSNLFSGERVWKDDTQALEYIVEMVKLRFTGKRLLMASTLSMAECAEKVEKLRVAMATADIQVDFADDVLHHPGTPAALHSCDGVLLLEQVDNTKMDQVLQVRRLAEECEKNVIGFVLV